MNLTEYMSDLLDIEWEGHDLLTKRLLFDVTTKLYDIINNQLPLVEKICTDPSVPVLELRKIVSNNTGKMPCGNRTTIINKWKSMVSLYLPDFDREIVEPNFSSEDPSCSEFICCVSKDIETDWWVTNSGDTISGEALKGIVKSGRTLLHPLTKKKIKYAFLNTEKMLRLRRWAEKNYPDLNDIYNDKYIHVPMKENLALSLDRSSRINALTATSSFKSILLLLTKQRSKKLPLSILIDNNLNHCLSECDNLPMIVKLNSDTVPTSVPTSSSISTSVLATSGVTGRIRPHTSIRSTNNPYNLSSFTADSIADSVADSVADALSTMRSRF